MNAPAAHTSVETVTACIIGSGFAGLGAAIRLRSQGIRSLVVLERADSVGGTWRDNTYPGCACDIPSHLYSFSFDLNPDWSHSYGKQPEIRAYMEGVVDRHGLRPSLRFDADVQRAHFDEDTGQWHIFTTDGRCFVARFLIAGLGPLRTPHWPSIPGLDTFPGKVVHTGAWDPNTPIQGKRVGVVGTGASAVQVVPAIAEDAQHVAVFQRTPPWVKPRIDTPFSERWKATLRRYPAIMAGYRGLLYSWYELQYFLFFRGPAWIKRLAQHRLAADIASHFPEGDPIVQHLVPDYEVGCKRVLSSSDWYPTLARPDVSVHPSAVSRVEGDRVFVESGESVQLDTLVLCTGYKVDDPLGTIQITGVGGCDLAELWGRRPRAYLGTTIPGFPNAFLLLGPNTGLGHNSVVVMIEAQLRYLSGALRYAKSRGPQAWIDVKPEALDAFVAEMDASHSGGVWMSGCRSWYLNDAGENFTLWPGSTLAYIARTALFDPGVYCVGSPAPRSNPT